MHGVESGRHGQRCFSVEGLAKAEGKAETVPHTLVRIRLPPGKHRLDVESLLGTTQEAVIFPGEHRFRLRRTLSGN